MRIGVPKEIKNHEYRVGLTPASVAELVAAGHHVVVETGAGKPTPPRHEPAAPSPVRPEPPTAPHHPDHPPISAPSP